MADTTKPEIVHLLRRINEGATNSQTPLGEVLRLCLRLGRLLNNKELSDWAKTEAGGYEESDILPDYRVFEAAVRGTFFGPFGSGYKNLPIPRAVIEEKHRDSLFKVYIMQSVGELEQLAVGRTDTNELVIRWNGDAVLHYQQEIIPGQVLAGAEKVLTTTTIKGVLEVIRTRVLEFVLAIEEELGINMANYDDNKASLEAPSQEKIHQIFNTTIHGGTSFAFGNAGTTNQYATQVQPGDLQGLKAKLAQLGVTEELITDLDTALDKDADSQEQPGPHVQGWFGRLMIKAGQGTLQLVSATATTVVMTEVRRFLGLPPV